MKVGLQYVGHGADTVTGNNDLYLTYSMTGGRQPARRSCPIMHRRPRSRSGPTSTTRYRLGNAVINFGVRYDYSKGMFPALPFLDAAGNPTGQMSPANDDVYHWNTFSPRVGINYKVNESGKTVVKAHYGRYYKLLEASEFRPAVPTVTTLFNFTVDAAGNRTNISPVAAANLRIDPNFKSPYNDQFIVQLEQQLRTNLGLQVNYVRKSGEDYGAWQDIAGQYVQVPYIDNAGYRRDRPDRDGLQAALESGRPCVPSDESRTGCTCVTTAPRSRSPSGCRRTGRAWCRWCCRKPKAGLRRAPGSSENESEQSGDGTFGRDVAGPNDFVNSDGRLIGDRPVVAKAQLMYRFPWGILVSGNMQHQTGRFYTRAVRVGGLGFPAAPQINMEPNTGDRRVKDINLFDTRVQKTFALPEPGEIRRVCRRAEPDQQRAVRVGRFIAWHGSTAFGVGTTYIPPRRLMLGAKVRW